MRSAWDSMVWFVTGSLLGAAILAFGGRLADNREKIDDVSRTIANLHYDVRSMRDTEEKCKRRIDQAEANAEIARAETIRQKERGDAVEKLLGMMLSQNMPPLTPPDLIPKQTLPTKPVD